MRDSSPSTAKPGLTRVPALADRTGPAADGGIRALTDVLPGPDGPLPLLILDLRPGMAARTGPAEAVHLLIGALVSMGLTLVTATAISEPPGPAPGWHLELSAHRAARLSAPGGAVIWDGECGQPAPWRALITGTGRCAVLAGAIGLWPGAGERAPIRIARLLERAAQAGELAGGLVAAG